MRTGGPRLSERLTAFRARRERAVAAGDVEVAVGGDDVDDGIEVGKARHEFYTWW